MFYENKGCKFAPFSSMKANFVVFFCPKQGEYKFE